MSDTPLTYAELFAGAGGLSLGLEMAGWEPVAHAEIEPHARAVLRHHWPTTRLDGDVTALDGRDYRGVTLLSGGSPCQDLSIAGKRAGMTEGSGTRSALYFEQVRIWQESEAPYFLWENVLGALSSNAGRDFAAVLSTLVGAAIPVPANGWQRSGVAAGRTGVAAWRVLDAKFLGVPHRRRRVFVLGTRTGGIDPGEILSVTDRVRGYPAPRRQAGQGTAADAGDGAPLAFNWQSGGDCRLNPNHHGTDALQAGQTPAVLVPANGERIAIRGTLASRSADKGGPGGSGVAVGTMWTLSATEVHAVLMRQREGKPGGGKGPLLSDECSLALGTSNDQVLFPGAPTPIPRRLMPVECERLMGWPDQHTAVGVNEKGNAYHLKDGPRYVLCGNGVASPVAAWIGWRLRDAIREHTP